MSSPEFNIQLTDEARDDLSAIAIYGIDTWGEAAADEYAAGLREVLLHIASFPRMGRIKEGIRFETRVLGHGQHVIYYRLHNGTVLILRILHARMDATHHLDIY